MIFLNSSPRRNSNQKRIITQKTLTTRLSQLSLYLELKNKKPFHSSTFKRHCWKHMMFFHRMSDSTSLRVTLRWIRKMPSPKSLPNSKKRVWRSEMHNWLSRRLKVMIWTNFGKNMAIITTQSCKTWKKATRKRSSNRRRTQPKTRRSTSSNSEARNMTISTSSNLSSRTSSAETQTTYHSRKTKKNLSRNFCLIMTRALKNWKIWSTLSLMSTQNTPTLDAFLLLRMIFQGKISVLLSVLAKLRKSILHDCLNYWIFLDFKDL